MSKVGSLAAILLGSQQCLKLFGQVAFRSLLAITPTVVQHAPAGPQTQPAFSLVFDENPLTDFVELPEEAIEGGLRYAKILEGVIRGSLEMVSSDLARRPEQHADRRHRSRCQ